MSCSVLDGNATLTSLNLSGNKIGAVGASSLASGAYFRLCFVLLRVLTHACAVCPALEGNTTLTMLNLELNMIGSSGASSLASGARTRL